MQCLGDHTALSNIIIPLAKHRPSFPKKWKPKADFIIQIYKIIIKCTGFHYQLYLNFDVCGNLLFSHSDDATEYYPT